MPKYTLIDERLSYSVIGAFFEVYNHLGYGFFESIYAKALEHELKARGHQVAREVSFQVAYKGVVLGIQRVDMIVDQRLIVESKAGPDLHKGTVRQLNSYLRASNRTIGLLLHFGAQPRFYRYLNRESTKHPLKPPDDPKTPSEL